MFGFVSKTIRHTHRYTEIVTILVKYGMGDIMRSLKITDMFPFTKKLLPKVDNKSVSSFNKWENIRMALEELGPTFIKLGQMLSNRPDIIPLQLIKELEKLQDTVPPFEHEEAVKIVESELEGKISENFSYFSKKPIAAASIAQVHKARLPDATTVAVKVQRPGIEEIIGVDVEILHNLASLAGNNITELKYFNPVGIIKQFEEHIKEELDFNKERLNIERFQRNFQKDGRVHVLKAHKKYSAKRVLTMELIEGVKVSRIAEENLEGYDRGLIAKNGAQIILKQIFIDGFFHADPHPGNIIILENNKICFIDFGMMGSLSQSQKDDLGTLIVALMYRNSSLVTSTILTIVNRPDHLQTREIEYRVEKLIERYIDLPLEEINVGELLLSLTQMLPEFELNMPPNFSFMVKSLITIEGVGRQLDPEFSAMAVIKEFSQTIIKNRLSPKGFAMSSIITLMETKKLIENAPRDIREILNKAKQGHIKIEFEHRHLGKLRRSLEEASNRLVFGIALGSLIIGSSIMVHANIAPRWNDIPVIGLIGFLVSGFMAAYILLSSVYENLKKRKK
ncbi:putative unusual protein kinase [Elusimicrobium minutum Pei191]|uniref:Putative unusual protein kinase n=1 Tax=Elusimicrobium minutum (strain Pei191) TaxID=445932 RepID=B2KDG2_ELUMP|nr:AarF/UbiB family protein [Elusimicrobium minutum]ACC98558.1 putative unusual protein kinase [Elusimicrobium minutum Pei191]